MTRVYSILCLFISILCYSQTWSYKKVSGSILEKHLKYEGLSDRNYQEFVDATIFLPKDYVKDGTVDYTNYLQQAIDKHRKILMPNFPVLINDKSLLIHSNTVIFFQAKSQLIMKPSEIGDGFYYMLNINQVNNVVIYNCKIKGDRNNHKGNVGEWGMGIGILGSSNIKIIGGEIVDCWGDGIYVGKVKKQSSNHKGYHLPSSSVEIRNVLIDNNRRNGVSITSGIDIEIKDCIVSNTNGTLPMSGVDVEPNSSLDLINNIRINNITTYNNRKDGILLVLTRITSDKKSQNVTIQISGHTDIGSYSPLRIGSGFRKKDKKMTGLISISNTLWQDNQVGVRYNEGYNLLPQVNFNDNQFSNNKKTKKDKDDKYLNTTNLKRISY